MVHCKTFTLLGLAAITEGDRPASVARVDHPEAPLRCHVEDLRDLPRCDNVLARLAEVRALQVDVWGWPAPFPDGELGGSAAFDVYLSDEAEGGAYVLGPYLDADPADGRMGSTSYMVLDPDISPLELPAYVAHEFNHALQFATDFTEPTYVAWEASATWAEGASYGLRSDLSYGAPDFQATPWLGLLGDSDLLWRRFGLWSLYEYGAVLWLHQLEGRYGLQPLDLWRASTNPTLVNEPDWLDAVEALTGASLAETLTTFALDRVRVGRPGAPDWALAYGPDARLVVADTLREPGVPFTPSRPTFDLGTAYVNVVVEGGPKELVVDGDPAVRWRVVLPASGEVFEAGEAVRLRESQLVGVVNPGPEGFDGDDAIAPRALTLTLVEAPAEDGDSAGDSDPGGDSGQAPAPGCGCGGGGGGGLAAALVGLLLAARRAQPWRR